MAPWPLGFDPVSFQFLVQHPTCGTITAQHIPVCISVNWWPSKKYQMGHVLIFSDVLYECLADIQFKSIWMERDQQARQITSVSLDAGLFMLKCLVFSRPQAVSSYYIPWSKQHESVRKCRSIYSRRGSIRIVTSSRTKRWITFDKKLSNHSTD